MNTSIRRGAALVAVLTTAATLAACSGSGAETSDPGGEVAGAIKVLAIDSFVKDTLAPAFEAEYPGTTVEVQVVGDIAANQQQVRTQLASGTAPDVFSVFPGSGNPSAVQTLAAAGPFLYDLSDRDWVTELPESLVTASSYEGTTYAGLYTVNSIGGIYNTGELDSLGLTVPTTWSEVLDLCAAATADGVVAYALGAQDQWVTQLINYALTSTTVYATDPEFDAEQATGEVTFADSDWAGAFDQYQQMIDAGCFQSDLLGTSYDMSLDMVASGDALAVVQGNWAVNPLKERAPDAQLAMAPFPATDDADATTMPVAAGAGLAVNAKSKNLATSLAWLDFAMSAEGIELATTATGGLPPFPVDTVTPPAELTVVSDYLAAEKTTSFPDQNWPNPKVQADHLAGMQEIISGTSTPDDVLATMQAAYDEG